MSRDRGQMSDIGRCLLQEEVGANQEIRSKEKMMYGPTRYLEAWFQWPATVVGKRAIKKKSFLIRHLAFELEEKGLFSLVCGIQ